MARPERFELPTPRFVVWCSIQLSYGRASRSRGRNERGREERRGRINVFVACGKRKVPRREGGGRSLLPASGAKGTPNPRLLFPRRNF
jgi:hypothetical protein